VSMVYRPSGVVFTQWLGRTDVDLVRKVLTPGTRLEAIRVEGEPGYWISGRPHAFLYIDARGEVREETLRSAGQTLIWERDGLILRLEGDLTRAEALGLARSVR
jgi:hypothetical protein